jgi:hypothetical protein
VRARPAREARLGAAAHTDPEADVTVGPIAYGLLLALRSTSAGCFDPIAEPSLKGGGTKSVN